MDTGISTIHPFISGAFVNKKSFKGSKCMEGEVLSIWFPKGFWKVPLKSLSGQPSNCCKNKYVTRRQSEWPILTEEGNCQEFCRNLCWNYDAHISLISNLGKGLSCKIKLLHNINFFWVTMARVFWKILKIKQVDYRMARGIQGMKM